MSDAVADQDVTKALAFEPEKNAVLLEQVVQLEDELVNRSMTEYAEVISEESREFWKQQLVSNREGDAPRDWGTPTRTPLVLEA